jgi:hypothetical protein
MEEKLQTRVRPEVIWQAWERAFKNPPTKMKYQIIDIVPKKSFTILWKALFVRLVFTHTVDQLKKGSEITYKAEIKGIFAIPARWILGKKIKNNLGEALKLFVQQLENSIR